MYTCNVPFIYENFGDVGLLVARLQGNLSACNRNFPSAGDSVVARTGCAEEIRVLRTSEQCIPLICFYKSTPSGAVPMGGAQNVELRRTLEFYHSLLQEAIHDILHTTIPSTACSHPPTAVYAIPSQAASRKNPFGAYVFGTNTPFRTPNQPAGTSISSKPPAFGAQTNPFGAPFHPSNQPMVNGFSSSFPTFGMAQPVPNPPPNAFMRKSAPQPPSSDPRSGNIKIQYEAPTTLSPPGGDDLFVPEPIPQRTVCPVCWCDLSIPGGECVSTKACGHQFHRKCLAKALEQLRSCPTCRKQLTEPRGKMPSGTMHVALSQREHCAGFEPFGSFTISYSIFGGIQKQYHGNPGVRFAPINRTAYLPDNNEGRQLVERLKYAFSRGVTFTVGRSLTTGDDNVVTWASIHHKTALSGGPHGYPDPSYFTNANAELEAVGVPAAETCRSIQ